MVQAPTLSPPADLPALAANCEASAEFYENNPGMTQHAGTIPDIYRTIALLARMTATRAPLDVGKVPIDPYGIGPLNNLERDAVLRMRAFKHLR